ncbi:MAG: hypothetical protein LBJ38_01580 [Oscillospiraceae bacterium]|nr:hypothetical protein [Oscillospiraceae bacterium]
MKSNKAKRIAMVLIMFLATGLFFGEVMAVPALYFVPVRPITDNRKGAIVSKAEELWLDDETDDPVLGLELARGQYTTFALVAADTDAVEAYNERSAAERQRFAPGGEAQELQEAIAIGDTQTEGITISASADEAMVRFLPDAVLQTLEPGTLLDAAPGPEGRIGVIAVSADQSPFEISTPCRTLFMEQDGWKLGKNSSGCYTLSCGPNAEPATDFHFTVDLPVAGAITTFNVMVRGSLPQT